MTLPTDPARTREAVSVTSEYDRFAMIPESILWSTLPPRAIQTFGTLLRAAREDTTCEPSRAWIADKQRCSLDVVDRSLKALMEYGVLVVESRPGRPGEAWRTNVYHLVRRAGGSRTDRPTPSRESAATGSRTDRPRGSRVDPTRKRATPRGEKEPAASAEEARALRATRQAEAGGVGRPPTAAFLEARAALTRKRRRQ